MVEVDMSIVQNEMSVKNFGDNLDDRISKAIEKVKILHKYNDSIKGPFF